MDEKPPTSIAGIATKYGLIQGVLAFIVFLAPILARIRQNWIETAVTAALLIVLIVLAHREFKRGNRGMLTYAQGLGSGTLLSSIAAVVASILTYVYVRFIDAGYSASLVQVYRTALEQRGYTGAQIQQAMAFSAAFRTPVGVAVSSLITWAIIGFIVALIVSIFTQRGDPRVVI
jgi:hypothetical protein